MKTRYTILIDFNKNIVLVFQPTGGPYTLKRWIQYECNTTFDVTITGLTFSSNRAHHLMIFVHIYSPDIFLTFFFFFLREREREREKRKRGEKERGERELCNV